MLFSLHFFTGGKFDHPSRLFSSIQRAWHNCLNSTTDVKELVPELFYLPELLVRSSGPFFGSATAWCFPEAERVVPV